MKRIAPLLLAALILAHAFMAKAHGPAFQYRYLTGGSEEAVLEMPEPFFIREVNRLLNLPPDTLTADDNKMFHRPAVEIEADELIIVMEKLADPETEDRVSSYTAMRRKMLESNDSMHKDDFDITPWLPLIENLPAEFALYVQGAAAYRSEDYPNAIATWTRLLDLPAEQRGYRSVWAAYMIGKAWLHTDEPIKSIPFFEQCRILAGQGFQDPLDLALDSLGWEAQAHLGNGDNHKALHQYIDMGLHRKDHRLDYTSMLTACLRIFNGGEFNAELLRDPLCRPVLTAAILSGRIIYDDYDSKGSEFQNKIIERWLNSILETGITLPPAEADDLAWLCYNKGLMDMANKWLSVTPTHTVIGKWVQTKLMLRDGYVEHAIQLLRELQNEIPKEEYWTNNGYYGVDPYSEVCAQLGVLLLGKEQYVDALDAFSRSNYWEDVAYLAERVLTPEELDFFLDSHKDDPVLTLNKVDVFFGDGTVWENLNYILARRLARSREWERARFFFTKAPNWGKTNDSSSWGISRPVDLLAIYDQFVKYIKVGQDRKIAPSVRAKALFEAGMLARSWGMEIFGTELDPDFAEYHGAFTRWENDSAPESRLSEAILNPDSHPSLPENTALYLTAGAEERRRIIETEVYPKQRYHYRWYAAELMWQAAQLLPDNDPLLAKALWHGGRFIATRNPLNADKFYKALVRRCPNLPIGQAAEKLRRFPAGMPIDDDPKALITIYVSATSGHDNHDGSSWAKAKKNIQSAIDMASVTGGSIWVATGEYSESIRLASDIALIGGFQGNESKLEQRELTNLTLSEIDASQAESGDAADHAVILRDITNTTIDGFWIKGGNARGLDEDSSGGGIFCRKTDTSNIISNCIVSGCHASIKGGGIFLDRSSPQIIHCTLLDNQSADSGGGLACIRNSHPKIKGCVLANNSAIYGVGGGLFLERSTPVLEHCWISGNWTSAVMGGGIYLDEASPIISNCMITGNSAGTDGGGLVINGKSAPILQFCTIVDNKANLEGGGVFLGVEAQGSFTNCIFVHNKNDGVYLNGYKDNQIAFDHCLFNDNTPAHYNNYKSRSLGLASQLNQGLPVAKDNFGGDPMFVIKTSDRKGKWTSLPVYHSKTNTTTLIDRNANFSELHGKVMLLRPNKKFRTVTYILAVNSPTSLEVLGNLTERTTKGKQYRLLDYRLQNGSIALNQGLSIQDIKYDIDGKSRELGKAPDVGAFEAPAYFTPAPDHIPPRLIHSGDSFASHTSTDRYPGDL